uniref:Uncharacterized protein n=1 Tax=Anguilla anguilla TaxID=7936 RepID=A0A0E9ULQ3_ANGAN
MFYDLKVKQMYFVTEKIIEVS